MANAVHGEARGEPYIGMVAVAAVILNRVESEKFPNSVSGVIFEPGAVYGGVRRADLVDAGRRVQKSRS